MLTSNIRLLDSVIGNYTTASFRKVKDHAVYFLYNNTGVYYIGKSLNGNLNRRLDRHKCNGFLDDMVSIEVVLFTNACDCDIYELWAISTLTPKSNKYVYTEQSSLDFRNIPTDIYFIKGLPKITVVGKKNIIPKGKEYRLPYYRNLHKSKVYNRLTIKDVIFLDDKYKAHCLCVCGTYKVLDLSKVVKGKVKSCGCLTSFIESSPYKDLYIELAKDYKVNLHYLQDWVQVYQCVRKRYTNVYKQENFLSLREFLSYVCRNKFNKKDIGNSKGCLQFNYKKGKYYMVQ